MEGPGPTDGFAFHVVPAAHVVADAHHIFGENFTPGPKTFVGHFDFSLFFVHFYDRFEKVQVYLGTYGNI